MLARCLMKVGAGQVDKCEVVLSRFVREGVATPVISLLTHNHGRSVSLHFNTFPSVLS